MRFELYIGDDKGRLCAFSMAPLGVDVVFLRALSGVLWGI